MGVADYQLCPAQTAFAKRSKKAGPTLFALRIDDVDTNHVSVARSLYAIRNNDGVAYHHIALAQLLVKRVELNVGIRFGQWTIAELLGLLIEFHTQLANLRFRQPIYAHRNEYVLHFARANSRYKRLLDNRDQRALAAAEVFDGVSEASTGSTTKDFISSSFQSEGESAESHPGK